ncbi:MAG: hypothetical protein QM772_04800 [Ottowia sp.]|uniref:hypothetical protein n=1 Tax=Ottowia sp. TaxID=1898956 RepID=UPI0039E3EB54
MSLRPRHPREDGDPVHLAPRRWVPACAGMTGQKAIACLLFRAPWVASVIDNRNEAR